MSQDDLFNDRPRRAPPVRQVKLVLPYPPTVNHLKAIFTPKGKGPPRMIDSEVGRAYKKAVKQLLEASSYVLRWSGPILLELDLFRPMRRGDLVNREKALSDGLQTEMEKLRTGERLERPGLFEDDEQIVESRMRRFEDKDYPRVQVTVSLVVGPSSPSPERWAPPPGWAEATALIEQAMEKVRKRERKKREVKEEEAEVAQSFAAAGRGLRKELRGMATPASYPPLPKAGARATTPLGSEPMGPTRKR